MEDKNESARKELGWFNNELIRIEGDNKPITVTLKGWSSALNAEIKIASSNAVGVVTEHSITDNAHILTIKAIPTEDIECEIIEHKKLENGAEKQLSEND